jgi:propionate CoA-transferase
MKISEYIQSIIQVGRFFLFQGKKNFDLPVPDDLKNPKFMTGWQAAELITDGACVLSNGIAANARCSIFYYAIRDKFLHSGHPKDLTWIAVAGQGARGRLFGSLEVVGVEGLIRVWIGGHHETMKSFLQLAQKGKLEVHRMPQGVMDFLIEDQARGEDSIVTKTGVGTMIDPRIGNGTPLIKGVGESLSTVDGDYLRYRLPQITVTLINAPYADAEGNIYFKHASVITENIESAMAARHNGGKVLVTVADIIPKNEKEISLPADKIDAIVVNPHNEQCGMASQRKYWKMFTEGANVDMEDAFTKLVFINNLLRITPHRGPVEEALARLAADFFMRIAKKGQYVNVGVGMPEEVCKLIYEGGIHEDITYLLESGPFGGMPAMGVFFGASINPKKIISSAQMFHIIYEKLDVTLLGLLQVDSRGNVNVSKRGEGPINYVGPGGFTDMTVAAKTIIFIGSWMVGAHTEIQEGKIVITKPGQPKFVEEVDEITFNGTEALKADKKIYYCTTVGVFQLTSRGMELIEVMPGIDIQKDIINCCQMKIFPPEPGQVTVVSESILTGKGFKLKWSNF